jgi:aldose 1-epimerase
MERRGPAATTMRRAGARPRSGDQHELRRGTASAVIASVGASLREYRDDDRDLVVPYPADSIRPAYRGATLVPWPNRVIGGEYAFGGVVRRLDISEPERGHALHGLGAWRPWVLVEQEAEMVSLRLLLDPTLGYPWRLEITTTFALGPDGLTQEVRAVNADDTSAPYGTAPHPYLVAGPGPIEQWSLELPAGRVQHVEHDSLTPTGIGPVDDGELDFRSARRIGSTSIDHAFTDLRRDEDGTATVLLTDPQAATGVRMSWDERCPWVQVHTADLPSRDRDLGHRIGVAVEPMTCAPGAMDERREHVGRIDVLAPGAAHAASWTLAPA